MDKKALCVARDDLAIDFDNAGVQSLPDDFFNLPAAMFSRQFCETEPALLQLIPYIVLRNKGGKIFCYKRGGGGGESRLHDSLSIGLGGHVDVAPDTVGLHARLCIEAERELLEEVAVEGKISDFYGLIYTGSNGRGVDKVHLGILTSCTIDHDDLDAEKDVIEAGRFLTLNQVLSPETFDCLEPWSQAAVMQMRENRSECIGTLMSSFAGLLFSANVESRTGATGGAMQELANIMGALGSNIMQGHALAQLMDEEDAAVQVADVRELALRLGFSLGLL